MKRVFVVALLIAGCASGDTSLPLGVRHAVVAGGDLWVLNEAFGRVVRIDAETGAVDAVRVGDEPTALAATADGSWVLTLTPRDRSMWAVRTGDLEAHRLEARPHHNAFVATPSGVARYAVTYVELASLVDVEVEGTASFNEVVVVDLNAVEPRVTPVVVGFNPRQVVFTPDGERAVVLSESYASILTLASPADPVRIPLGQNTPSNPVTPQTVLVTPDGTTALVARRGSSDVFVITLDPPSVNIVDAKIVPTKFAASADGASIVSIAEGLAAVSILDLATGAVTLVPTGGPVTDAVAPLEASDRRMLLWGRGAAREELYYLDLVEQSSTTVKLVNPPTRIVIGPGGTAVALHQRQLTPGGDEIQRFFDAHESLSVLDAEVKLVNPVVLDALPTDVAFSIDGSGNPIALATLAESGRIAIVQLDTQLSDHVTVPATPRRLLPMAGPLQVAPVAVIHDHAFGLVTFLSGGGDTRVVGGFLLTNALD